MLESWRTKRVIEHQTLDDILATLDSRRATATLPSSTSAPAAAHALDPHEIRRRMEEDRERHKRLRERRWVQPVAHNPHGGAALGLALASFLPLTDDADGPGELTLYIEFENEWEATSDWNEDDDDAVAEENTLCFPREAGEDEAMDLS